MLTSLLEILNFATHVHVDYIYCKLVYEYINFTEYNHKRVCLNHASPRYNVIAVIFILIKNSIVSMNIDSVMHCVQ